MNKKSPAQTLNSLALDPPTLNAAMLNAIKGQVVFEQILADQRLQVYENECYSWFTLAGDVIQAIVDKQQPAQVLLPVPQALLLFLLWHPAKQNVLNLGMGGGSIERALHPFPQIHVSSVEQQKSIITMAKRYFTLPDDCSVHHLCAHQYLATSEQTFDIILCDLFFNEQLPNCLRQAQFYQQLKRNLTANGTVLINLAPRDGDDLINYLSLANRYFSHLALIDFSDYKNIVLVAANQPLPDRHALQQLNQQRALTIDFSPYLERIRYIVKK